MNPDSAKPPLKPGSRVRCKHSAVTGTVLAMPGAHSGSPDLFAVLDDAGEFRAVHPTFDDRRVQQRPGVLRHPDRAPSHLHVTLGHLCQLQLRAASWPMPPLPTEYMAIS